jgi:hypothetical protein
LALAASFAWAHGGFPWATDLVFDGDEPVVVTTFGLLARDAAGDWTWTCEEVVGTNGITAFVIAPDGAWLAGTVYGLFRSEDRCTWEATGGEIEGRYFTEVVIDARDPEVVLAATASGDADNALWRSEDGGRTFSAEATFGEGASLRGILQAEGGYPLVVTGWRDLQPYLWRDDGEGWTELALALEEGELVYPLGLDGEGLTWLRGVDLGERLLRVDAAGTIEEVLASEDGFTAFDAGPEAAWVLVGDDTNGLRASADGGGTWTEPTAPRTRCLRSRGDQRYACTHNWSDGAAVMRAALTYADPADLSWREVLWFGDVHAPAECPAGSTAAEVCGPLWEEVSAASGMNLERADSGTPAKEATGCGCGRGSAAWLVIAPLGRRRRRAPQGGGHKR